MHTFAQICTWQIVEREERDSSVIYNFYNSVIPQLKPKKGSYRSNAVKNRCREFAHEFYEYGFSFGSRVRLDELKYWIVALELAHDRITVNQYVHRLCIYGYFYAETSGEFTFLTDLPGQNRLPMNVLRKQRGRLRCVNSDRRIKRRSY